MQQNTDSPTDEPRAIRLQEITDFEITLSNGQYWISYGGQNYPVILTPHQFKRLFEVEGLLIEEFTGDEPVCFSKAILLRREWIFGGDLFDEDGGDVTPQTCWVKEVGGADATHP